MSERNRPKLPDWAEHERAGDLAWIGENLHLFWPAARQGHETYGRGAIVVDTTLRPTGKGHPFVYFPQETVEQTGDEDTQRMVGEYDPSGEFVAVLLKTEDRVSSYRLKAVFADAKENGDDRGELGRKPEPPDLETLMEWEAEGGCEATDGCWVEADGTCPHGHRSWLLELGLI